jgi:hypothetical protein
MSSSFLKLLYHVAPPNQSLKLTEPAVGDFARAKQPVTIGRDIPRAEWLPQRRGSPPQLSSGPLGGITSRYKEKNIGVKRIDLQAVILPTNFPLSTEQSPRFGSSSNTKI